MLYPNVAIGSLAILYCEVMQPIGSGLRTHALPTAGVLIVATIQPLIADRRCFRRLIRGFLTNVLDKDRYGTKGSPFKPLIEMVGAWFKCHP
jgi:hypothetical protein